MVFKAKICRACYKEFIPTSGNQVVCLGCRENYNYSYRRSWILERPEKRKQYTSRFRSLHLDEIREKNRKYKASLRRKNPEHLREIQRTWRRKNAKKHRETNSKWRKDNREKTNFMNRRDALRRRGVLGTHSMEEWEYLKRKNNYMCLCCREKEPIIKLFRDHIIPVSKGGSDNIENIQPLCNICNCKKWATEVRYA